MHARFKKKVSSFQLSIVKESVSCQT